MHSNIESPKAYSKAVVIVVPAQHLLFPKALELRGSKQLDKNATCIRMMFNMMPKLYAVMFLAA